MKMHKYVVFLNTLIFVAPIVILDCHAQTVAAQNAATQNAVTEQPPISMGKPMTLDELMSALHDTAGTKFDVDVDVYNRSFSKGTKIYISSASSLPEFYDHVTQAAGLKWRTGEHGEIVLYRGAVLEQPDLSAVAKAN